jgi:hypothetical protein
MVKGTSSAFCLEIKMAGILSIDIAVIAVETVYDDPCCVLCRMWRR